MGMTLDEAIWKENALAQSFRQRIESMETTDPKPLEECEKEHRQLAEWLRELKAYKSGRTCFQCKHEDVSILYEPCYSCKHARGYCDYFELTEVKADDE